MMDYVVTGASGFVGAYLVREILKDPKHRVIALVRQNTDLWRLKEITNNNLTILEVDFSDVSAILEQLQYYTPNVLFHLAWEGVISSYRDDTIQKNNFSILHSLLEVTKKLSIGTFVGIGSQAEYGIKNHPIAETASLNPVTLYGHEKVRAYEYTRTFCTKHNIKYIWLRLFSSYGPMDNPQWLIPYVINELLNQNTPLLTSGIQIWDYLYVEDVARAIFLSPTIENSGAFNLGSGIPVTIKQVVDLIYTILQQDREPLWGRMPLRENQTIYLQADVTKFVSICRWTPRIPLIEGIAKVIAFHKTFYHSCRKVP